MSRGNREATQGILKHSMRDNYSEHGVEEVRSSSSSLQHMSESLVVLQESGRNLPESPFPWRKDRPLAMVQQVRYSERCSSRQSAQ